MTTSQKLKKHDVFIFCFVLLNIVFFNCAASAKNAECSIHDIGGGNYVHFGNVSLTTRSNMGDIANIGIIIGRDAVAVVDTGGSFTVGEACLTAIKQITTKPLRYVINTHEHPDHIFGNGAFLGPHVIFVGSHSLPASIQAHGEFYLKSFRETLGKDEIDKIKLIEPTVLVDNKLELDIGDRKLLLSAWTEAHSDSDLMVLDERTHTLFAGDLVFADHTPVIDGSLKGWLRLLPEMAKLPAERVIPGHGQHVLPWPEALNDERRYLEVLQKDTLRLIAAGTPLAAAVPQIGQSEREHWKLFDDYNPRNATTAYSELEWEP